MGDAPKAMGHGIKQRDRVRMTDAEVTNFLETQRTMTMATLNADATIHLVAMWYGTLDGKVVLESKARAQKVINLRRNPAMSILVEAMLHKRVIVVLQPTRVTSWDHRKLGLPPMPVHA